jgi:hypothetical protein
VIWSLHYLDKRQARIVDASGKAISGTMDWMEALALVEAHNSEIKRFQRETQQ